ncbi:hypothetical protein EMCRGX_G002151 [Ephydatia muelleri]|eukprot:Em0001g1938a
MESLATQPEQSEKLQNSATAQSVDNSAIAAAASLPKVVPLVGSNKSVSKKSIEKKIIYSLNVTLSCTEDGSIRERELGLTWVPETIADLQDEVQDQFNIPVFDQKLTFGPTTLSSKESIHSYSLRSGDSITVEYTTEADVAVMLETVTFLQKTLTFLVSVEPQLHLFPISRELEASLQTEMDVTQVDVFRKACHSGKSPKRRIADSVFFVKAGGLNLLQRLHSAILRLPFKVMPLQVQLLEIGMCQMMWTLSAKTETEAFMLEELKLDNIVQSLFRVTLVPNATISPPRNPYTEWMGNIQLEVINELIATSAGCLACVAEYESPNIQIELASSPKFLEQIEGALQSLPASFRNSYLLVMSLLTALAYNLDTHRYLCKPHVIQSIIRTWKNADPTPENNATRGESVYLKYCSALQISMLCASRHSFTTQYLQINELLEQFLSEADANEIHTYERELDYWLNKYIPYLRVVYMPFYAKKTVQACGSDQRYRNLQMMCIETHVLFFQVILIGERERKRMVDQGLMDYVVCLPSVLPAGSRAQQRAKDLVTMLGKEMHLQPPSLNTMARARLAATHFGFDRVLKAPVQELLSEVY